MTAIDHLVYATSDLARGIEEIEQLTGVTPTLGGQHIGRGTRNALIDLGNDVYLEIVAPDPDQPPPSSERWFGVDQVTGSRIATWVVKGRDLSTFRERAVRNGVPLGEVRAGGRQRPDGVKLSWQVTEPVPLIADGVIPFFIDWGASPHPSRSAAHGATLVDLHLEHPDVSGVERMLRTLDVDVPVIAATSPAIVAVIEGRHGRRELR